MGHKNSEQTGADLINGKVKKKCCRSRPRCRKCPVVALRLRKAGAQELTGKDLKRALKRARAA
ncbi:MAG TPA: hypothetical protein VFE65_05310 [Pseudonocardia sp.]|nr:hypothetical protein [Pseudonocardia sp.]